VPNPVRTPVTRLGLQINSFTWPDVPDSELFTRTAEIARTAERSGFDSVWVMDHFYQIRVNGPRTEPMLEAYTLLSGIAARTERVSVGGMVTGVTYRNPALLAKTLTTLDIISQGRAILGIGAAWNDDEHAGYGFEFPPLKERFERLEDALQICGEMFRNPESTVGGRHFHTNGALNLPQPVRPGGPPILIGGSGERKTIPLVARYADACNFFGDVATIQHKLEVLDERCADVGRDSADITKTRLGAVVIGETHEQAVAKAEEISIRRGLDPAFARSYIVGDADGVAEQVAAFLDVGLDGMIISCPDAHELEPVERVGEALSGLLAERGLSMPHDAGVAR
jgi:F420-dependent oxidoreductase-like protein